MSVKKLIENIDISNISISTHNNTPYIAFTKDCILQFMTMKNGLGKTKVINNEVDHKYFIIKNVGTRVFLLYHVISEASNNYILTLSYTNGNTIENRIIDNIIYKPTKVFLEIVGTEALICYGRGFELADGGVGPVKIKFYKDITTEDTDDCGCISSSWTLNYNPPINRP